MLTDRQLMWFDEGEQRSLENWYADGNRGRPWARVVALDTMKVRKVAEVEGEDVMDRVADVAMALGTFRQTSAILMTYVGMTLVPEHRAWRTQPQIQELFLSGDPIAEKAGRALYTVGTDENGYFYTVISRFEVDDDLKLTWEGRWTNCLSPRHLELDPGLAKVPEALEEGRRSRAKIRHDTSTSQGVALPLDMEDAAVAMAATETVKEWGMNTRLRDEPNYRPVRQILVDRGVKFYEESK